jgi:glutamate N-acetyltransferase/amino-acid N-acetyltransferase
MSGGDSELAIPRGFRVAAVKAGIKQSGNLDLVVVAADSTCAAAGTFTTNRICAAPVKWSRSLLPSVVTRAIVVNSGNANAATGAQGLANAERTAAHAALALGCRPRQVLVASTGVIGHQLPMAKIESGIDLAVPRLSNQADEFRTAAAAIMTTDTHPKLVSLVRRINGRDVTLLGMAKGAAMIGPRMATMLGFLLTDAPVWPADLKETLGAAVDRSFNCLSVEGHASTNDTVLILSSTGNTEPAFAGDGLHEFGELVREACESLAKMIANDGEGATHFITIDVEGCDTVADARAIARAVADSPLVKTAIHGADPNWGRIVSAAGYAGVAFAEESLSLWLNGVPVYQSGVPLSFDAAALSQEIKSQRDVHLRLVFSDGVASIRFWTCDLTAEYIRLNADYTT